MSRETLLPDRLENSLLTINQLSKILINNEALRGSEPKPQLDHLDVDAVNLNAKGLGQYIGERALDRLRENKALLVGFTWDSARGRA
ncbi:hypothetical protein [Pseudomonas veronii]|uniref:hypothetical protein n=1 Tax=Pseudomonas veronii TaxID=76761 RepID=UPI0021CC906D|nr:hypothetical protein [Pseudomonas veronii]